MDTPAPPSPDNDFDLATLEARAQQLVEAAQKAGADGADAIVAASRAAGIDVREGKVEEAEGAENNAFSLRVFVGHQTASVSANQGDDPGLLAKRAVAMARVSPPDPLVALADEDLLARSVEDLDLYDATEPDHAHMEGLARACEEAALAVPGVAKSSGASFGRALGGTVLATSHGFLGSYRSSRFSLSVSVVAGEGTAMERDYDFDSMRHFTDLRHGAEIGRKAGEKAVARLNPRQVKTQTATVIFDPRMARGLVGHVAGALNGASVVRKTSFLRDRMGEVALGPQITIVDEPHLRRGAASRPFDGEGVANDDLTLVKDGRIENWLLDGRNARALDRITNGRANRAGSGTSPGSTNLTLLPGATSRADMIGSVKSGFYVTELIGQGVNMVTGDYSRGASGFWIENGKLTFAVSEVTIAGKLQDMFARMVPADDLEKRFGTNAPTIAIEGMTIAGR
ncbi:MAG: metallopeptidase TldD-related protein [Pseudomonadota bacterium]